VAQGKVPVSVIALFQEAAFAPDVTQLMSVAFDRACKSLHDRGQPDLVKEIIANRIIDAARRGVRDPDQLCDEALAALGQQSDRS